MFQIRSVTNIDFVMRFTMQYIGHEHAFEGTKNPLRFTERVL